ncbi:hypothetical protein ER308_12150 [Egibacter rhizosphaerae]|uniref:UPF0033 domain-containing protein n=1 Tax=Egibacter rhizosphaerae TaxID=1670831 RepID=A0A411YG81_9ACTN|nr:helix-turn-helix domain-containing protein [Egibacter rhizosphaerae]QBI20240.1 hypothetical protein ER308_12150 [Egibacter rhizosphaerae]
MTTTAPADQWQRREQTVSVDRAFASQTRAQIHERLLADGEPWSVREVADAFDLHPNVARSHLELLADAGLLSVGRRKHPSGGRPAKVYRADDGAPAAATTGVLPGARLQVALLAALADAPAEGEPRPADARARAIAVAEGRRLAEEFPADLPDPPSQDLEAAVRSGLGALRPHAPQARVVGAGDDHVDVAGVATAFQLVREQRPELADALERGLLEGVFAGSELPVSVSDGPAREGEPVRRLRLARGGSEGPLIARRLDARALPRESGVVRAMREITALDPGEVLEVIAGGPGSPAAFARWADRAAHQLLAVERATDEQGRPGIRLLIRKGDR